ncbi:MAG: chromosome partitioning protein ParB [Mycobacteriaceae bacterium]
MARDTGFPASDAENDFARLRRRQAASRLAGWLRRAPDDVNLILPFADVVKVLGKVGERRLGLQVVRLETIVGTVDRTRDFDRYFRPTSGKMRQRWERLATAQRRGESVPPIDLWRVGELHFVEDGHHRVSIAFARRQRTIDAYVTEVLTRIPAEGITHRGDLLVKDFERIFAERVPLPSSARDQLTVADPWQWAVLGEAVEAWGYRLMQREVSYLDRATVGERWFTEEYVPVVRMLRQAEILPGRSDAEAYLWVVGERYRLLRRHTWDSDVVDTLAARAPKN